MDRDSQSTSDTGARDPADIEPERGPMNRKKPTLLDRLNNAVGHIFGASGKRRGARDPDPGQ